MDAPGISQPKSPRLRATRLKSAVGTWSAREGLYGQARLLELFASREPLPKLLDALALFVETLSPGMLCSILLADRAAGVLRPAASPSLPKTYTQLIDPVPMEEGVGSCGTAAARRAMVVVADVEQSPLWKNVIDVTRRHGLRACWSIPVLDDEGEILGTLGLYYRTVRTPTAAELDLAGFAGALAGIVIQRHRDVERLQKSDERYRTLAESCADALLVHCDGVLLYANRAAARLLRTDSPQSLIGQPLAACVDAQSLPGLLSLRRGILTARLICRDGAVVHAEIAAAEASENGRPATVFVCRDVTDRVTLEQEIIDAADREQERLAYELHDGLCQELTGIACLLATVSRDAQGETRSEMERVNNLLSEAIHNARMLATGMSPVTVQRQGLPRALAALALKLEEMYAPPITVAIEKHWPKSLDPTLATHLYRITQEAVTNALRHAGASGVAVVLSRSESELTLTVTDDGEGIVGALETAPGLGLRIMRYRAGRIGGRIEFQAQQPSGTRVRVVCPLP
jgi:PAS domain S-box-containing protein